MMMKPGTKTGTTSEEGENELQTEKGINVFEKITDMEIVQWQIGEKEETAQAHRINTERISYRKNRGKGTKMTEREFRDCVQGRELTAAAMDKYKSHIQSKQYIIAPSDWYK